MRRNKTTTGGRRPRRAAGGTAAPGRGRHPASAPARAAVEPPGSVAGGPPRAGERLLGRVVDPGQLEALVDTPRGLVRVRGGVPGDELALRLVHVGKNALWGALEAVVRPGPQRVTPRCGLIAACGGCPWQAWDLAAQRAEKTRRLGELLAPLGAVPLAPLRGAAVAYGFRNKVLVVAGGRPGALTFGLYAPRSHALVPAADCPVQVPAGTAVLRAVGERLSALGFGPAGDAARPGPGVAGRLRHVLVRVAPGTGQVGVTLVVQDWPPRNAPELAAALAGIPDVVSLWLNHQPQPSGVALGPTLSPLAGQPRLLADVRATRYLLTPTAFFQTNTPALPLLVDTVDEALPAAMEHLVDLFAGVGLFSLAFAPRSRLVTAIEADPRAARDLAAAARHLRLPHVRVESGDARRLGRLRPPPDALVVDPPRGGLGPALVAHIATALAPRHLVYVSCAPAALARDLAGLVAHGYRLRRVTPVDLFPHTPHVETVAALVRA